MINLRSFLSSWLGCIARDGIVPLIAALQLGLHLWVNAHDNFFRDELYYLAAGRHLDFGFVEYPPLVAVAAAFSRVLLGSSLLAARLLPALSGVVVILLTADMVRRMGGGLPARVLAAVAVALGPVFIGSSGILSMDPFDQMWWALCAWALIRLVREQEPRFWLLFGLFAGLGLLNKLTVGFYCAALVIGLLLSNQRRLLFNRWLVFGGLLALLLVSPFLVWNAQRGFPTLEYTRAYAGGKTYQASPIEYFLQQLLTINPFAVALWLGGLYVVFFTEHGKPYRFFGWAYLFLYVFFMLQHAKFYWLSPSYPALFACAACGLERLVQQRPRLTWLQPGYAWTLGITGLLLVPLAIPILPTQAFIRFNKMMGGAGNIKAENLASSALPQSYADRQGWREMVSAVKQAYDTLTPQEQEAACILARNYGEAGAIDHYGEPLGLPNAISGHNSYFQWGPQDCTGEVMITVNYPAGDLVDSFESVKFAGQSHCDYCMPFENGAPIFIARGLKYPMQDAWPTVKDYN